MSYLFLAIESENLEKIKIDIINFGGLEDKDVIAVNANHEKIKFRQFNMIADLYIWTTKYWYGTYFEKLIFIRVKNLNSIPTLFLLKYGESIRLAIKSEIATIIRKEFLGLLTTTHKKSIYKFDEERICEISTGMKLLEKKWELLLSNKNPYPRD